MSFMGLDSSGQCRGLVIDVFLFQIITRHSQAFLLVIDFVVQTEGPRIYNYESSLENIKI